MTLFVAPAFKVLAVGLTDNQFTPVFVCVLADQVLSEPQLVIVTVCALGSLTLATPLKLSLFGLPVTHPACTVSDIGKDFVVLAGWLVNESVTE